jgi:hypothetical protein
MKAGHQWDWVEDLILSGSLARSQHRSAKGSVSIRGKLRYRQMNNYQKRY